MSADGSQYDHPSLQIEAKALPAEKRRVWDLPLRIFHWSLALAFAGSYATHLLGPDAFKYHLWFGYSVLVLVSFRILWGIVGTYHARFWNFVRGPIKTVRYTRDLLKGRHSSYAGHNPLGALMVIVLLGGLLAQALFGLFSNDEIFNTGPLYGYVSSALSLKLTSLHRYLFWWLLGAIVIHVAAVIAHRFLHKEKLVQAMITGRKSADVVAPQEEIRSSRIWLAAVIVATLVVTLAWIIKHAPVADSGLY